LIKRLLQSFGLPGKQEAQADRIDVRERIARHSVEEFNAAAEEYFKRHADNTAFFLKKPLGLAAEESAQQLIAFAEMLNGLKPLPGMRLLDFGAGTCWTSRYFADFKLDVVACDVSPTALAIGRQLFSRNPPVDTPFKPSFLVFNGRRLELPDESIDRIACFDAFHHVPNPHDVLRELGRVLKPGGIAGFSEPGPNHSKTPQSQAEMKNHLLVENDIVLEELWPLAKEAGFTELKVAVFNTAPFHLDLEEYNKLTRKASSRPLRAFAEKVRRQAGDRRLFFLHKGGTPVADSRNRAGLLGEVRVELKASQVAVRGWVEAVATAKNTGKARWLPSDAPFGPVKLGIHLRAADGQLLDYDFGRANLPVASPVEPGQTVEVPFRIMAPARPGDYLLEFDMVSEHVCWFEANGARPSTCKIQVK